MATREKPLELVQAQVAMYAANEAVHNEVLSPGRNRTILENLGSISMTEAPDLVEYPRPTTRKEIVDDNLTITRPKGTAEELFTNSGYVEIVRRADHDQIKELSLMIASYSEFAPVIDGLGIVGLDLEKAREHPNFLSFGGQNMAFRFSVDRKGENPKQYVAVFAQNPDAKHIRTAVNDRAICLALSKGIQGLEQGAAVSYDPPVVISELAPGNELYKMTHEERLQIPDEHWQQLEAAVLLGSERGISIDGNSDNFLYDPDTGFTIIDFRRKKHRKSDTENLEYNLKEIDSFKKKALDTAELRPN